MSFNFISFYFFSYLFPFISQLEAKDIPHEDPPKELGVPIPKLKSHLIYSDEIEEKKEDVIRDIDDFEKKIAKPVQLKLASNFVNIYDNRNYFGSDKKVGEEKKIYGYL